MTQMDPYQSLREHMEDLEDLLDLRNAKAEEAGATSVDLDELTRSND